MSHSREIVLMDYQGYNKSTNQWAVPILKLQEVKLISLNSNGQDVPLRLYRVDKNIITFHNEIKFSEIDKVHQVIEISPQKYLVTFWLPVILAILGLIGTIGQPLLHSLGIIYKSERNVRLDNTAISYNERTNEAITKVTVYGADVLRNSYSLVPENETGLWSVYVAVKEEQTNKDLRNQCYNFFSGPYSIEKNIKVMTVTTDSAFTQTMINTKTRVLTIFALVRKGTEVVGEFCPGKIKDGDCRIFSKSYYNIGKNISF